VYGSLHINHCNGCGQHATVTSLKKRHWCDRCYVHILGQHVRVPRPRHFLDLFLLAAYRRGYARWHTFYRKHGIKQVPSPRHAVRENITVRVKA
jgi:hypothetical protein